MHLSDMPALVEIPFGASAGGSYIRPIPVASQIGITAGAASFTDGFPPLTFTPLGGGGAYVNGEDINGILNYISSWTRWLEAGSAVPYNSAFATKISGYPNLATVPSTAVPGLMWMNTVDGNLTDPDGGSPVGWVAVGAPAADLAEAKAGVVTDKYISPAVLKALGLSGPDSETIVLPGGFLLKFKSVLLNTGSNVTTTSFTWATPFPTALLGGPYGTPDNAANSTWTAVVLIIEGGSVSGGTILADTAGRVGVNITNTVHAHVWAIGN